jgi:hypothetical protein
MRKIADDKYESVCTSCISFLQKSIRAEMGILRCSVAQTDVRRMMHALLLSDSSIIQGGSDVYLVAEVLHCSLKAMSVSLLSEWYGNITLESKEGPTAPLAYHSLTIDHEILLMIISIRLWL